LGSAANNAQDKARLETEKRNANRTLGQAYGLIDPTMTLDKLDNNDRAAQLANAALDAVDPDVLDAVLLTKFLSLLRDRAPDLSDDLFVRTLDVIMSATVPNPGSLQELAKYLFTAPSPLFSHRLYRPASGRRTRSFGAAIWKIGMHPCNVYTQNGLGPSQRIENPLKMQAVSRCGARLCPSPPSESI
jgi:hypothetical protein